MINRRIIMELEKWMHQPKRKPLVLRGARQVGKTTVINQFSENFEQYIYVNLELPENKIPFQKFTNIETLVQTLFFNYNKLISKKNKTLLFIDEIQEVPEALNILRYFHENEPKITVIAAGSMLETLFNKKISFPVGRVEYLVMRPVSFPEFLDALGEKTALQQLIKIPIEPFTHNKLLNLFHTYVLIGGMPEIVSNYINNKDIIALSKVYDSLITSYLDDVEKYSSSTSQIQHIRHAIKTSYSLAGKRITFEGFGNSSYRSRDMSEALHILEKALLIHLIYPCTSSILPLTPNLKKSPRLQVLDTGLINYFVGIQKEIIGTTDLNSVYNGAIIEHIVGQEILAIQFNALSHLNFWVREKKTSTAEVDYLFSIDGKLIPIEVKSGTEGRLKSLHLYMDTAPHNLAIRFYAGELSINKSVTQQSKEYYLLSLPYYLASQIEHYILWFQKQIYESK